MQISETSKMAIDGLSVTAVVVTLAGMLPAISAVVTIVWMVIRIIETDTVKQLRQCLRDWKKKRGGE